jgi:hypothetical protein
LMGMRLGRSPPVLEAGEAGSPSTQDSAGTLLLLAVYATTSKVHPASQPVQEPS